MSSGHTETSARRLRGGTSWARAIARGASAALLATMAGLMLWSVAPVAFGFRADVVLSDSMAPRIRAGDVVLARPAGADDAGPGQVILFTDPARPERTLIHRVVRREADGRLVTRGDANPTDDTTAVDPGLVKALPQLRVPWVGLPASWVHDGDLVPLVASGLLLALVLAGVTARDPGA